MKTVSTMALAICAVATSCTSTSTTTSIVKEETKPLPSTIVINELALNPEGIEFNKDDSTFFLSSINAAPIIKIKADGSYIPFTSGEKFPLSTAGLQVDHKNNRLLAAGFNGMELFDQDPETKGAAFLRSYNLQTGVLEQEVSLAALAPDANMYFANDIAIDDKGNTYISDWYARVVYKVDKKGTASLFWTNTSDDMGGPNGLDFHPDGYLLVSILSVNEKGLYADFSLVKIPTNNPESATTVNIPDTKFTGFDGMVINPNGHVVGVTNNGSTPGGNSLIELSSSTSWESAEVVNSKAITPSTTVAITPDGAQYVINQDFTSNTATTWTIEQIKF